jgi:hypothetical protein
VCPTGAVIFGPRPVLLLEGKRRIQNNPGRYYQNRVYGEQDNGGTCPRAYLLSIQGESYEPGDSFSAPVANRLEDLRARLHELIQQSLRPASLAS